MPMNLTKFLCCPSCKSSLVNNGSFLFCQPCNKEYEVKNGVYNFVNTSDIPPHLRGQIKYFEDDKIIATMEYKLDPWQKSYLSRFLVNTPSMHGKLVIDCGCGSAYMTLELAKRGAFVVAIDLSMRSLVRLKVIATQLNLNNRILCVCSTAEVLPIQAGAASTFISNAVLEHLPDELSAISEMNRTTVNDAYLMLTVPLSYRFLNPILMPLNWIHDKQIGHLRRYDENSIFKKFNEWSILRTYFTGHTLKVIKTIVNMVYPIFDLKRIEQIDELCSSNKYWASNVICFLKKRANK